jgi:hypothetical protein
MNKRSSRRPSKPTSTPNDLSFKNKDAHQDQTRRDSGRFSNPRRNKLSLMRLFIQLTLLGSIVHAGNYHSNQPVTQDNKHLVVFKELGLMFNPSHLSDAEGRKSRQIRQISQSLCEFRTSIHHLASE